MAVPGCPGTTGARLALLRALAEPGSCAVLRPALLPAWGRVPRGDLGSCFCQMTESCTRGTAGTGAAHSSAQDLVLVSESSVLLSPSVIKRIIIAITNDCSLVVFLQSVF